jgi:hypothetical protein
MGIPDRALNPALPKMRMMTPARLPEMPARLADSFRCRR